MQNERPDNQNESIDKTIKFLLRPEGSKDVKSLRSFLTEKLTVRQLLNLVALRTAAERNPTASVQQLVNAVPNFHPTRKRNPIENEEIEQILKKPSPAVSVITFPFSHLIIGKLSIESPPTAVREMNTVRLCSVTSRLVYDCYFMLENDWCSCVISIKLDQISRITTSGQEFGIVLKQPAVVEASYKNCRADCLPAPKAEIVTQLVHRIFIKYYHDFTRLKDALVAAEPDFAYRLVALPVSMFLQGQTIKSLHNTFSPDEEQQIRRETAWSED